MKDLRQTFDEATHNLDGDTTPVRRLVFDLHGQLRTAHAKAEEANREAQALRERLAVLQGVADGLSAAVDSQKQRMDGLGQATHRAETKCRQAEEAAAAALKKEPVPVGLVLERIELLRSQWTPSALALIEARARRRLENALDLEPGRFDGLSDVEVRCLIHAGFNEYQMLMILLGKDCKVKYDLEV
jgi:chromosome segregation ATPase